MKNSGLDDHRFHKGKFITPFNDSDVPFSNAPWFEERLPEYIWLGLILQKYGRNGGLNICAKAINILKKYDVGSPMMSELLAVESNAQKMMWREISEEIGETVLIPLSIIFTYSKHPEFAICFSNMEMTYEEKVKKIEAVLREDSFHQNNTATDIRFLIIYFYSVMGRLSFSKDVEFSVECLKKYPFVSHASEEMDTISPAIRAMEMGLSMIPPSDKHREYLTEFWESVSTMSECKLFVIKYEKNSDDAEKYIKQVKTIMGYYRDMFVGANPLDNKMLVLLGIATYSYKRVLELVNHNLYNEISGRSIIRVLIENYIMMKYLLKHEEDHNDIWSEYQYYGIGQYKLIVKKDEKFTGDENSHVNYHYLSMLVNEFKSEEFIDMDTNYFNNQNIRLKAESIGEKELYGLYYDYDSAYEHGLWGAIRESSLLKCDEAAHQYHCVPDINDEQKLKSVWHDVKMVMNKIIGVLKEIYGLPEQYSIEEE